MGLTGAGKSTLINCIARGPESVEFDDDTGNFKQSDEFLGNKTFSIGHELVGHTQCPGFGKIKGEEGVDAEDDVYIIDCPGLCDSNKLNEYPNHTLIHWVATVAKSIKVLLVYKGSDLSAERGKNLLQLVSAIHRFFTPHGLKNLKDFMIPILNFPGDIERGS